MIQEHTAIYQREAPMITGSGELIEQFKAESGRAGAVVYEAENYKDANDYVLKVAQEHDVKHVVKSKSMLTEEIKLREYLENNGIDVKEANIGEWIAKLAGKSPANVTQPAMHRTIEQVTELLSKVTGENLEADPQVLVNAARRTLRQFCIDADMGISEADIAIAETGTLITTSDEGDDRLVAILPSIHVTMAYSKNLASTLEEAIIRLKVLNENEVSRKIPRYITYITGRNTTGDIPGALMARAQGPEEEYIILVDKL